LDFAHPDAFVKILRIIVNENMTRFSSVVRAMDVWLGFKLDINRQKDLKRIVQTLLTLMTDEDFLASNLTEDDPEMLYLSLWVVAFRDVADGIEKAKDFLDSDQKEIRFVSYLIMGHFNVSLTQPYLVDGIDDEDLQIAVTAFLGLVSCPLYAGSLGETGLFEKLEALFPRLPKLMNRTGLVWPWTSLKLDRSIVTQTMISSIGTRSPLRLVKFLPDFDPDSRASVLRLLAKSTESKQEVREVLRKHLADRSYNARNVAHAAMSEHVKLYPLSSDEAVWLESLLTWKSSDVRRSATKLLLSQSNRNVLGSIERLFIGGNRAQKKAAKEIIQEMCSEKRSPVMLRKLVERLNLDRDLSDDELLRMLDDEEKPKREDGLGIYDPAKRMPVSKPNNPISKGLRKTKGLFVTAEVITIIKDFDQWLMGQINEVVTKQGFI
jgi:hypothetical protein